MRPDLDNMWHGKGKFTCPDGGVYEGDYVDGKKHGKGKFTRPDGCVYVGDYVDGKRSSLGRYVFGSEISYNKAPPRLPGLGC